MANSISEVWIELPSSLRSQKHDLLSFFDCGSVLSTRYSSNWLKHGTKRLCWNHCPTNLWGISQPSTSIEVPVGVGRHGKSNKRFRNWKRWRLLGSVLWGGFWVGFVWANLGKSWWNNYNNWEPHRILALLLLLLLFLCPSMMIQPPWWASLHLWGTAPRRARGARTGVAPTDGAHEAAAEGYSTDLLRNARGNLEDVQYGNVTKMYERLLQTWYLGGGIYCHWCKCCKVAVWPNLWESKWLRGRTGGLVHTFFPMISLCDSPHFFCNSMFSRLFTTLCMCMSVM